MSFGAYGFLAVAITAGVAAFALAWLVRWRVSARARFGAAAPHSIAAYIALVLLIAASAVAAFAAARPQWGAHETRVEERGIDVMIVLDVSQSMLATDTPPSRLQRAQDEVNALLAEMSGDRAGLVIFAGAPFPRSALTADLPALATIVEGVDEEDALVPPGSDLGAAIERAHEALVGGEATTKAMLIVSDGEDHGGSIAQAIAAARAADIRVYTAGVGTEAGSPVVDLDPETGALVPRVVGGEQVTTRLDAAALEEIAATGGGRYIELAGDGRPLAGLAGDLASLESTTFATEETATPIERFQLFAAIALALVVMATAVHLLRAPAPRAALRLWPAAGAALFIAGICSADAADHNRRGNREYEGGAFGSAVNAYRTAEALDPQAAELNHNAGNALDRAGQYEDAAAETERALPVEDESLEAVLEYALGNHYAGAEQLEDAMEAYRRSLLAAPDDVDAKYNFELTSRRLTPTATPTPPVIPPELQPTSTQDDPTDPSGAGTPGPAGTPDASGSPEPGEEAGDLTPEELQRLLEDALAGIDEDFTIEEAIRVLELLEQRNRDALDEGAGGESGLPDY